VAHQSTEELAIDSPLAVLDLGSKVAFVTDKGTMVGLVRSMERVGGRRPTSMLPGELGEMHIVVSITHLADRESKQAVNFSESVVLLAASQIARRLTKELDGNPLDRHYMETLAKLLPLAVNKFGPAKSEVVKTVEGMLE